jgi:diguanylate cyclase (GGDEF)-like protein
MRETFVGVAFNGLLVLLLGILAILAWRVGAFPLSTGFRLSVAVVAVFSVIFFAAFFFRERLRYEVKAGLLVVVFVAGGCAGLPTLGFTGGGTGAWMVTGCFFAALLFSRRIAIGTIALCSLSLMVAAIAFVGGWIKTPVNLNIMIVQPAAWANVLVSIAATSGILAMALNAYSNSIRRLLQDLDKQREQIEHMATHDNLTGLPLLSMAVDRCNMAIHHAQRVGKKVAVLFIDLDGFKAVNDQSGHEAGDHVLREVAQRLKASVRATDTAARIGGDEFMVVLTALDSAELAAEVAEKVVRAVLEPVVFQAQTLQVGASIGIAVYPDHGADTQFLRKAADHAMYGVKRQGKNRYAFAKPSVE